MQLEESGAQTRHIDQRQHHQGDGGKSNVDSLNGHFVESALPFCEVGVQDITNEVVQVEEDEEEQGAEDRDAPGRKQIEGEIFDLQRRGEEAHINRDEAHSATELHDRALGFTTVTAQENLERKEDKKIRDFI